MISQNQVRRATHANSWYSGDQAKLGQELTTYLSNAKKEINGINKLKAIIAPHAGYEFSGPTAAWSYQYLNPSDNLRVFLFGPSHYKYIKGCYISSLQQYETPLGQIQIDVESNVFNKITNYNTIFKAIQQLQQQQKFAYTKKSDEEQEHSLEMHLPYIFKSLNSKSFKLIPIMVGELNDEQQKKYGQIFSKYFDDENTIFIVSSDFCHWGKDFQYMPYNKDDGEIWKSIEKLDRLGIQLIEQHKLKDFNEYLKATQNTICGQNPIRLLLSTIQQSSLKNIKTKLVQYQQSEKVKDLESSSVSYSAMITYI